MRGYILAAASGFVVGFLVIKNYKTGKAMGLSEVFGKSTSVTIIFRGDGRVRGYQSSAAFKAGGWFDLPLAIGPHAFRADTVTVKALKELTQDDLRANINGTGVMPLVPGDEGPIVADEPCTVVRFNQQQGRAIPPAFYAVRNFS